MMSNEKGHTPKTQFPGHTQTVEFSENLHHGNEDFKRPKNLLTFGQKAKPQMKSNRACVGKD